MISFRLARPILVVMTACAVNCWAGNVLADEAQDNAQLREQMRIMMQQMQEMQKQIQELKQQQQKQPTAAVPAPTPPAGAAAQGPAVAKAPPPEPAFEKFVKGFYGTLDVSTDYATKGMSELGAFHWSYVDPANPQLGYVQGSAKVGPV